MSAPSASFAFATATKIVFGAGELSRLPELARGLGERALLVLGRSGRERERVEALLGEAGVFVRVARVEGEPSVEDAVALLDAARRDACDLVVGVGGGSVIDAAKAVSGLLRNPGDPYDYLEVVGRGQPLAHAAAPFIAVPTTSGTGAEVTKNAVLASKPHGVKVSLRSDSMLPSVALLDPELTVSLPPELTASTGLDALTQCLEPFVSRRANPLTDALARQGLALAAGALRRAYHDGRDLEARSDMALVSLLGGLSLANAKLGAVHGFAGPIGGAYPAPHGAVCARLLPGVVSVNARALEARAPQSPALERYGEVARLLTGRSDARIADGVAWLQALVDELGVPPLGHYGLNEAGLAALLPRARAASSMQGNPIELSDAELLEVAQSAL